MPIVGAGFGHHVNLRARGMAVLGGELRGLYLELRDGIENRSEAERHVIDIHVADAVEQEAIVVGPIPGGRKSATLIQPDLILLHRPAAGSHVRGKQRQIDKLTAVQRQGLDFLIANHRALRGRVGVQHRNFGGDLDGLRHLTDRELNVKVSGCGDIHGESRVVKGFEALGPSLDVVTAGRNQREDVFALRVRGNLALRAGGLVEQTDLRALNGGTLRIGHPPSQGTCIGLSKQGKYQQRESGNARREPTHRRLGLSVEIPVIANVCSNGNRDYA
jgi:hypothetical protein